MTIEIRQLVIRASVQTPPESPPSPRAPVSPQPPPPPSGLTPQQYESLVRACVRAVMRKLDKNRSR
jgi:hypothetical protein